MPVLKTDIERRRQVKYHRVSHNCVKQIMSGAEVSLIQQSGGSVKILRRANDEEVAAYAMEQNGHIAQQAKVDIA
jgi:hypothetical protein